MTTKSKMQQGPMGLTVDQLGHGVGVLQRHLKNQHEADELVRIAMASREEFLRVMAWKEEDDDRWRHPAVDGIHSGEDALELTKQALQICGFFPT